MNILGSLRHILHRYTKKGENSYVMSSGNKNSRWWKEGILYQIYPQSFKDSNGDGFGDLNGVIDKLDYLESLGITIVWMNPFYESPLIDNGYDVSDYRAVLPRFGQMQDFERMIKGMHKRGIKFVMDLVVNHSSEEHPWFKEAKKSRESPFYDYYHWWPAENGQPPYRHSLFDPNGAWEYVDTVNAYYLHTFTKHQPDLNWENPKLRKEIFDIMKFWANKGVDGYRLDAFQFVSKDITWPNFPEGHEKEYVKWYGMRPQLHGYLNEMYNEVLSKYDVFAVAEGTGNSFEDAHDLVDESRNELQMAYHFETINLSSTLARYSLFDFKQAFTKWDQSFTEEGWLAIFLANHDNARLVDRFGNPSERFRTVSTQLLNTFLMSMRGTPYLYYGDELGMTNIDMPHIKDYDDIEAHGRYQAALKANADMNEFMNTLNYNSRENGRTPMQWDSSDHAGFTFGTPWKKVNPNFMSINVALQEKDPKSVLNHFRKMTRVRKTNPVLVYGKYDLLLPNHEQVYAFTRQMNDTKMLILLNFSEGEVLAELDELSGLSSKNCVINNYDDINIVSGSTNLQPYQATILKMS